MKEKTKPWLKIEAKDRELTAIEQIDRELFIQAVKSLLRPGAFSIELPEALAKNKTAELWRFHAEAKIREELERVIKEAP